MGRGVLVVVCTAFLGGCALPMPVQIASWALDGISLLATEKSLTDHGISMVAQKDCALWRGVTGREICVDKTDDAGTVLVASVEPPFAPKPVLVTSVAPKQTETRMPETTPSDATVTGGKLVDFDTASGKDAAPQSAPEPVETPLTLSMGDEGERLLIPGRRVWSDDRSADLYFVIGSFSGRDGAREFVRGHSKLGPAVMASRLDGKEVYRVAVGPFVGSQKTRVQRKIKASGLNNTWAIRIDHGDWMIAARPVTKPSEPMAETVPAKAVPPLVSSGDDQLASAESTPQAAAVNGNLFYVVGSFDVADNARNFAAGMLNDGQVSFEPAVVSGKSVDGWRHRVVVGPFGDEDRDHVRSELIQAGVGKPWSIRLSKKIPLEAPMAYRLNATNPSAAQVAGSGTDLPGSG